MAEENTTKEINDGSKSELSDLLCRKATYCKKEFLTDSNEPSTSTVVSFCGDIKWSKDEKRRPCKFFRSIKLS